MEEVLRVYTTKEVVILWLFHLPFDIVLEAAALLRCVVEESNLFLLLAESLYQDDNPLIAPTQ